MAEGRTRDGRRWLVRKYRPGDRERVRYICGETGFVGEPQEAVFIGRDEFADLWSLYWTDYEPENAFVGEVEGQVEAYLFGCLDARKQERIWAREIVPAVVRRLLRPAWWKHKKNRLFIRYQVRSRLRGELKINMAEIYKPYPAHLHINIADPGLRGQGLGKALMLVYFDFLRQRHVPGVHLGTTSHNRLAVPFYYRLGFTTLVKKRVTFYDHAIADPPLYLLYLGKKLD